MATSAQWWAKGDWFDVCSCNIACPCEFAQPPTGDFCEGVLAWHIERGAYGDVPLDDLNVVAVSRFTGNVWAGDKTMHAGMYMDERATDPQRAALTRIFTGQAGGFMANLAGLICEVHGIEFVPVRFEVARDLAYWSAEVPGKVQARAEALSGPTTPPGARVQLLNAPGSEVGPGQIATWGKTTVNTVTAYGYRWDWSGKSSKHIPFDWVGP